MMSWALTSSSMGWYVDTGRLAPQRFHSDVLRRAGAQELSHCRAAERPAMKTVASGPCRSDRGSEQLTRSVSLAPGMHNPR